MAELWTALLNVSLATNGVASSWWLTMTNSTLSRKVQTSASVIPMPMWLKSTAVLKSTDGLRWRPLQLLWAMWTFHRTCLILLMSSSTRCELPLSILSRLSDHLAGRQLSIAVYFICDSFANLLESLHLSKISWIWDTNFHLIALLLAFGYVWYWDAKIWDIWNGESRTVILKMSAI